MVLLLSAENFLGIAITLPFRKLLLAIRYSPIAAVSRLADLPISRFADKIRLGRSLALQSFSAVREHCPPETANSAAQESSHSILNHHGNRLSLGGYQITSPTTGSPKTPSSS